MARKSFPSDNLILWSNRVCFTVHEISSFRNSMARKRKAKTELSVVVPNKKMRETKKEKYDENLIIDVFMDLY